MARSWGLLTRLPLCAYVGLGGLLLYEGMQVQREPYHLRVVCVCCTHVLGSARTAYEYEH